VPSFGNDEFSDDLFEGCEVVVTQEIVNQRVAAAPLETRGAAAVWGEDGRCTLWASTQNAQQTKAEVAGWLGIDADLLHVITPDVGGGFGAKIGADPEFALVAWLARRTGRPVRWNESRSENMTGMLQGRAQLQTITIGGNRDGKVLAYRLDVWPDAGAYPRIGTRCRRSPDDGLGPYDIPKVESRARVLVTNDHVRSAPTAAPGARRRPRRSSGRWTCSPPRSAWTAPRCASAT
jgi:carbon-monoxide dehydrogenase large subunit